MTKHSRSGSFLLLTGNEAPQDAHTPDRRVKRFGLRPERIALFALALGVGDKGIDEL